MPIRSSSQARIRPILAVLASVLLLTAALSSFGCAGRGAKPASGSPERTPAAEPASPAVAPPEPSDEPSPTPPAGAAVVTVYYPMGEKLASATRVIPTTKAVASAALVELLEGPTAEERKAGMETIIPEGTELRGVAVTGGTATVDLSGEYSSGGGTLSMTLRLSQVVYTLTQFPSIDAVSFKLDGKPVTVFSGEGLTLDRPQTRGDFADTLPPIFIDSPGVGATVGTPSVRVRGSANVFEGVFQLALLDAKGATIADKKVTTSGTGTRGEFDTTLSVPKGKVPVSLIGYYYSPKDGKKVVTVRYPLARK